MTSLEILNFVRENIQLSIGIALVVLVVFYKLLGSRSNINMSGSTVIGGIQDGSTNKTVIGKEQKIDKMESHVIERISKSVSNKK